MITMNERGKEEQKNFRKSRAYYRENHPPTYAHFKMALVFLYFSMNV